MRGLRMGKAARCGLDLARGHGVTFLRRAGVGKIGGCTGCGIWPKVGVGDRGR